jgi:hypothetical protein
MVRKAIEFSLPFVVLAGFFPIHLMLAPPRTPITRTARPYLLIAGCGMVLFAVFKLMLAAPVDLYAQTTFNTLLSALLEQFIACVGALISVWLVYKHVVYLRAVYDRSGWRISASIVVAYMFIGTVGMILAVGVGSVTDAVFASPNS